jgi:septum formation topological specificity factor MinE
VPFLISTSPSTSLLSLRSRIAKVLQKYSEVNEDHVLLFVSTDGIDFALVEDGPISELMQNGEKIE